MWQSGVFLHESFCSDLQQDSCGEEERSSLVTLVKPSAKPRRTRLLSKGRKLNNKKRGRPKKAPPAVEKNKKNQSALDLLHAKTLCAAPAQGQGATVFQSHVCWSRKMKPRSCVCLDSYRPAHSPFYQLPPKVQHYTPSQLLLSPTPPGLQQLLGNQSVNGCERHCKALWVFVRKPRSASSFIAGVVFYK